MTRPAPKISLITVSYNSAATIEQTLQSVAMQDYDNFEYIVVDGNSKDNTVEIVKRFGRLVTQCVSEPDKGNYDAYNKGLKLATGDVIGFINSDDFYVLPDVLTKIAQAFKDPSIEACYGDLCYVKRDDTDAVVRYWRSNPFKAGLFLSGWCPPHPTLFVRRDVYERFGNFDLSYKIAADVELMIRFIELHKIKTVHLPLLMVKMRMGGMTNSSWSNVRRQNAEIWSALQGHGFKPNAARFFIGKILSRSRQYLSRPR